MTRAEIKKLEADCREAAETYMKYPGMAGHGANAGTIADIYMTLAKIVGALDKSPEK